MNQENEFSDNSYDMLKCIWMASNVVEYKLCDKKFDCENCQFDKVMRNFTGDTEIKMKNSSVVNIVKDKLDKIKFEKNFTYLKNCFIIKEVLSNTYYLGINPILISFLDNIGIIMECGKGKNILKGQPVVQFFGEWGTISLTAPMNFSFYDKVNNPADDLVRSKWIAIIGAIPQEISVGSLEQNEWETLHKKSLGYLEEIKSELPQVGLTLMDGGNQVKYLHQLIGKEKFVRILQTLAY